MSRAALTFVCCSSLMGCIITRDPSYSEPRNTPAVVLEDPSFPMTDFHPIDMSQDGAPDGGVGNPQELVALVRDPDVDQELTGLIFLDYDPNATRNQPISDEFTIPASTNDVRTVRRFVDFAEFPRGCHVLELHVSEAFVNVTNPVPREAGDLGRGIWHLRVFENDVDVIELRGCRSPSPRDSGVSP